ncbi:hypothetical protein ACJJTC_015194 [Scirpophaga incertulas]
MTLQKQLEEAFKRWKPKAPAVIDRTKSSITLSWKDPQPFAFVSDQLIYRVERNRKIPRWVVEYSGRNTTKLIDNLASRYPYRFRLKVILKSEAVSTLADRALRHFGDESKVYEELQYISDSFQNNGVQHGNRSTSDRRKWLESQWSEETWSSTESDGTSAICFSMAVRCGYLPQVQQMLEDRPSLVGVINPANGYTPLAIAVKKGDVNMVKLLLSAGGEVDQPSLAGQTALHLAVLGRESAIFELLLENSADLKSRDVNGLRVEHYAVDSGDVDMLKLVLDNGGDLTVVDNNGWTPLFRAVCQRLGWTPLTSLARVLKNRHGQPRDSILRLVDSNYPHEKALANFTRLSKKIHHIRTVFK